MTDDDTMDGKTTTGQQAFLDSFGIILSDARNHATVINGFIQLIKKESTGPLNKGSGKS